MKSPVVARRHESPDYKTLLPVAQRQVVMNRVTGIKMKGRSRERWKARS